MRVRNDREVERFLSGISKSFGPLSVKEVLVVARSFPTQVRDTLDAYYGIEFIELGRL